MSHHSIEVTTTAARLRFRGSTYADITALRVVPPPVPPGCSSLIALVFEVRPDEKGASVLAWKFAPGPSHSARVDQALGPIRTSGPLFGLTPDAAPGAACPDR